ncbi:hypothetical protein DPEC_G00250560 [Dallia pectoralis]|uniref:Uncharacterized protein n=1 Tax=Dallia pectoralis TaxID=75939 RepID=A0ACC2FT61_DALPE|nr:hypothetical protein DPEC_G00250560 [Dallia pectoralis]
MLNATADTARCLPWARRLHVFLLHPPPHGLAGCNGTDPFAFALAEALHSAEAQAFPAVPKALTGRRQQHSDGDERGQTSDHHHPLTCRSRNTAAERAIVPHRCPEKKPE